MSVSQLIFFVGWLAVALIAAGLLLYAWRRFIRS
jgi:hypothetical protein